MEGGKIVLVKYKTPEMSNDGDFLEATYHDNPVSIVQTIRYVDNIKIRDEWYRLSDMEFVPATDEDEVDVLNIYLDYIEI